MRPTNVLALVAVGSLTSVLAAGCNSSQQQEGAQTQSSELFVGGGGAILPPPRFFSTCTTYQRTADCVASHYVIGYEVTFPQGANCPVLTPSEAGGGTSQPLSPDSPTATLTPGDATPVHAPGTYVCRYHLPSSEWTITGSESTAVTPGGICNSLAGGSYDVSYILEAHCDPTRFICRLPPKVFLHGKVIDSGMLPQGSSCSVNGLGGGTSCDTCIPPR